VAAKKDSLKKFRSRLNRVAERKIATGIGGSDRIWLTLSASWFLFYSLSLASRF
jgi:hypothetical protein